MDEEGEVGEVGDVGTGGEGDEVEVEGVGAGEMIVTGGTGVEEDGEDDELDDGVEFVGGIVVVEFVNAEFVVFWFGEVVVVEFIGFTGAGFAGKVWFVDAGVEFVDEEFVAGEVWFVDEGVEFVDEEFELGLVC